MHCNFLIISAAPARAIGDLGRDVRSASRTVPASAGLEIKRIGETKSVAMKEPILIVGAGSAASTTALALAQTGWPVRVLEGAHRFEPSATHPVRPQLWFPRADRSA